MALMLLRTAGVAGIVGECPEEDGMCVVWAKAGDCMKNRNMFDRCPRACGLCDNEFAPCPRIDLSGDESYESFWEKFGSSPKPIIVTGVGHTEVDFWSEFGVQMPNGGRNFEDAVTIGGPGGRGYSLDNEGYSPRIFERVGFRERYPLPELLQHVDQRMVLSIGINGSGERDMAHHYHPITVMRLLQGRKIWAMRPPGDQECELNRGACTDPLNVCDYYAQPDAPEPACVQEAGETIVVPGGWYHGTCNNASVTVGWGAQGRNIGLLGPQCFHCNARNARGQVRPT